MRCQRHSRNLSGRGNCPAELWCRWGGLICGALCSFAARVLIVVTGLMSFAIRVCLLEIYFELLSTIYAFFIFYIRITVAMACVSSRHWVKSNSRSTRTSTRTILKVKTDGFAFEVTIILSYRHNLCYELLFCHNAVLFTGN